MNFASATKALDVANYLVKIIAPCSYLGCWITNCRLYITVPSRDSILKGSRVGTKTPNINLAFEEIEAQGAKVISS